VSGGQDLVAILLRQDRIAGLPLGTALATGTVLAGNAAAAADAGAGTVLVRNAAVGAGAGSDRCGAWQRAVRLLAAAWPTMGVTPRKR
jgi:hypothetical protein